MRVFKSSSCRGLRRRVLRSWYLSSALLALSVGCAEFRSVPSTPLATVAVTTYQVGDLSPVSAIGYQEQPKSPVLSPVKELPPIGKIGKLEFSLSNPDEQ